MPIAIALVLASGFLHAYWNYLAKRSLNKHAFLWHAQWVAVAAYAPIAGLELWHSGWAVDAAPYAVGSMLLHGMYIWLLAHAYRLGDLSQVYPILRGTAPLVIPIAGVVAFHEPMNLSGWIGVVLIVIGIVAVSGAIRIASMRTVALALLIGIIVSSYIVWDKLAISRGVPPVTLNTLSNVGNFIALSRTALSGKTWRQEWRVNRRSLLIAGIAASGGYTLFLFAIPLLPIGQLAPMREIGTVFGTVFGIYLLGEPAGKRRIVASIVITAGIVLLSVSQ